MVVAWHDLLGVPWKLHGTDRAGMDCSTVAEEVLRRTGVVPPATSPFRMVASAGDRGEMASYFAYMEEGFDRIGSSAQDATRTGDIVLGADSDKIGRHLYVLVEPSRGTFLSATHDHGVIAVRRYMVKNVLGVYRAKGALE